MRGRRVLVLLGVPAGLYLLWAGALFLFQHRLIFPRQFVSRGVLPPPRGAEVLVHEARPGRRTEAFLSRAPSAPERTPVVVFFHGNAERAEDQEWVVGEYHRLGWSVLLMEYPGYGASSGSPSQAAIREDALGFFRMLTARPDVDAARVVLAGRSIGGGVAADLAAELARAGAKLPAGLVLWSTPASVAAMALRYGVPPFLVRSPFRTDEALRTIDLPVLLLQGRHDRLVPLSDARRLAALAPRARLLEYDGGHNDSPAGPDLCRFRDALTAFLAPIR